MHASSNDVHMKHRASRGLSAIAELLVIWPLCVADADIIFCSCGYILLSFCFFIFFFVYSPVGDWMSTILPHMMWP